MCGGKVFIRFGSLNIYIGFDSLTIDNEYYKLIHLFVLLSYMLCNRSVEPTSFNVQRSLNTAKTLSKYDVILNHSFFVMSLT